MDIREYYERDGELHPGKKGISISIPEWQKLRDQFDEIEEEIKRAGGDPDQKKTKEKTKEKAKEQAKEQAMEGSQDDSDEVGSLKIKS